jgi:hypothetical protein
MRMRRIIYNVYRQLSVCFSNGAVRSDVCSTTEMACRILHLPTLKADIETTSAPSADAVTPIKRARKRRRYT